MLTRAGLSSKGTPMERKKEQSAIDTLEARRRELRRVLNAHLKGAAVAKRALAELDNQTKAPAPGAV